MDLTFSMQQMLLRDIAEALLDTRDQMVKFARHRAKVHVFCYYCNAYFLFNVIAIRSYNSCRKCAYCIILALQEANWTPMDFGGQLDQLNTLCGEMESCGIEDFQTFIVGE